MCGQIFGHGYLLSKHTKIEKQTKVRTDITERSTHVQCLNIFGERIMDVKNTYDVSQNWPSNKHEKAWSVAN